jgi:hypothetical protein
VICLLISVGAVLISIAYLAWEFHVAPVIPDPGTAQAIQDAPATGQATVPPSRRGGRIYLTDRETNQRAADLDKQLPADRWEQLAPLYLTPEEPAR